MTKPLRYLTLAGVLGLTATMAQAQTAVTPASLTTSPYSQNFDGLAGTGSSNAKSTLPTGWDFLETGTSALADNLYAADNGASNSGNVYSYGATGGTDRSLGGLLSSSLTPTLGGAFTNNTGVTLTTLTVTYTGETWRIGTANRSDKLQFQYSTDANSLSTGTWTDVTALDYANPGGALTASAGISTPAHSATITSQLTGLNFAPGTTIWLRWNDYNASGSDDGMAVDDFSLAWTASPTAPALTISPTALTFANQNVNTTSTTPQTYSLSGANLTAATTVTVTGPFTVSKDNTTYGTSLSYTAAELATAKTVYVKFTPTAGGPATGSVSNASTGAATRTVTLSGTGVDPNQTVFPFSTCASASPATAIADGWTQYSVTGAQTWACTTFGRDPNAPTGTTAAPYGVQMNGYSSGNVENEDWLISPAFNLTSYNIPVFQFWSRTAFNGPGLKLRVSTNYTGSGAPSAATWTDLSVQFPGNGSDTWTQSAPINLSAYKSAGVYVAFVYTSTTAAAARWTLDDISLSNASAAPAPVVYADASRLPFGYQAVNTSGTRTLTVGGSDLTGNVTLTSSNPVFTLSKDGTTYASSVTLTPTEVNLTTTKAVTVRFTPTTASTSYAGTITLASTGATSSSVAVSGDTYDPAKTLEVANWNIEWFGSSTSGMGPSDKALQQANVTTVLTNLASDVYMMAEVVDTARLRTVVNQLSTNLGVQYGLKICDFGSYADDANDPDYNQDQKLAFIYRKSVVSPLLFQGLLRCTQAQNCAAYTPWASGRFPYLMRANVTLDGVTKLVNFIVIHAKANATATSANDWQRRKDGAQLLKAYLDTTYPGQNTLIAGDYNDVLNGTIATALPTGVAPNTSSYVDFMNDAANYTPITLALANSGAQSTVSYPTVIDNVITTKQMGNYYLAGTAAVRTDLAAAISNYGNTTSDHYPVYSRYSLSQVLGTKSAATAQLGLYPNPVTNSVRIDLPETGSNLHLEVLGLDGRLVLQGSGSVEQLNQQLGQRVGGLSAGLYLVRVTGAQQTYVARFQKQ